MPITLHYLDFEHSEDTEGVATFEAMASVGPAQLAALHAEIEQVLTWAYEAFADVRGPLDEGFEWDHDLQSQREFTASDELRFDPTSGRLQVRSGKPGLARHTVTLSITGSARFAEAFMAVFNQAIGLS